VSKHRAAIDPSVRVRGAGRGMIATAALAAGAIAVGLVGTGATYALWNDTQVVPGAVDSGTASLTINDVASYPIAGLNFTGLLPGRSVATPTPLTVKNTGAVPLTVTPGSVNIGDPSGTLASQLVVAIHQTASCTLTPVGTTATSFTSFVVQPNQTTTVCVEVQLKPTAPANVQGNSATFSVLLNGVQVAS